MQLYASFLHVLDSIADILHHCYKKLRRGKYFKNHFTYVNKKIKHMNTSHALFLVGATGIEPMTPCL